MAWKGLLLILAFLLSVFGAELRMYFIDVGEGESTLVVTPEGKSVLIDTGNVISGFKVVEFLEDLNIRTLDALIITHPHPDHMSGVFAVLNGIEVQQKFDNGQPLEGGPCEDLTRWYGEFFRVGNYRALKNGDVLKIGGIRLKVINSYREGRTDWNANSLVLLLEHGSTRFLLMGDANKSVERELIEKGEDIAADVLKVGHHGASDVLLEAFLREVNPTFAVISINRDNIRGYPSGDVLRRLKRRGVGVFITYRDGTVVFVSDGEGIRVSTEK